jgi:hypothetical protein
MAEVAPRVWMIEVGLVLKGSESWAVRTMGAIARSVPMKAWSMIGSGSHWKWMTSGCSQRSTSTSRRIARTCSTPLASLAAPWGQCAKPQRCISG